MLIYLIIVVIILIIAFMVYLLAGAPSMSVKGHKRGQIEKIMNTQRNVRTRAADSNQLEEIIQSSDKKRVVTSNLTLEKRLRYALWKIPPVVFFLSQIFLSILIVGLVSLQFDWPLIIFAAFSGPLIMNWVLNYFINKRFKQFDKDYSPFLLNVVSMLRIGMNTISGIKSAAETLNPDSLVREEVFVMLDRLKLGVSEEKSIGAFGQDIFHPEIELFVQAVILSRRLGGNLSETLDRLASQVRKRQHFRESAEAAVGLQRGSIWIILAIMIGLEIYIYITSPDLITSAFHDDVGWMIWQAAIVIVIVGVIWVRQVTKLKI